MAEPSETRKRQLRVWIDEAEMQLRRGLPLDDEHGEPMSMASSERLLDMWREELGEYSRHDWEIYRGTDGIR